jgi:chromosome segregation ATPase
MNINITMMISQNRGDPEMISAGIEAQINRLESIVEQIGEAVLSTTETIERLAQRIDALSIQVEAQGKQVEQQGYQIFALCDALQSLAETQQISIQEINQLTKSVDKIVFLLESVDE